MPHGETTKSWRRDEYTDKETGTLISVIVVPELDVGIHYNSLDCDCIPLYEWREGVEYLIHSSFDGREERERSDKGN